jgi:BolA protein
MDPIVTEITHRLREALSPHSLRISDLGGAHKKHPEARKHGGGHYALEIVSDVFNGLKSLERQKWIYGLLGDLFESKKIHALQMQLKAPGEVSDFLG